MSFKSLVVLLAAGAIVAAGCSSSSKTATPPPDESTTTAAAPGGEYTRPACNPPASTPPVATPVAGTPSDYDVVSFDNTKIRAHWFPVQSPAGGTAPTLLEGPGWSGSGSTDTEPTSTDLFGGLSISNLRKHGYNVLTWDPRGFGASGGTVTVNSPDFEGRDVQRLIDWVARQPGVQLDKAGDPRMGMAGASYGGGIQLTTAALDCRVDAIVPQIAWHSLGTSLFKAETPKTGWGNLLTAAAAGSKVDPHVTSASTSANATGLVSEADAQWFVDRGPGDSVGDITAPTLFEQGTIDTLFTLDEAATNFEILRAKGVPTAMLWMCSGHGACLTKPGDPARPGEAAIAWFDRYVKNDTSAKVGPTFEYVDQNGTELTANEYPPPASDPIEATGGGELTLTADGGAGPTQAKGTQGLGSAVLPFTPARASNAVNVPIEAGRDAFVVGAPKVTITYTGTVPAGERPTRVFAQLVDEATGLVLGNQITPIEVTLDGKSHTATVPLEMVAFTTKIVSLLTLQLVATTPAYAEPRLGGTVTFDSVKVELPTVTGVTPK